MKPVPSWRCSLLGKCALAAAILLVACPALAEIPSVTPAELVRRTVQNELQSNGPPGKYMFRDHKKGAHGSETKLMVETRDALAAVVIAIDDKPLTPEQRKREKERVDRFINDPAELKKKQDREKEDGERVRRILKALPDSFLYEYAGTESGAEALGKAGDELVRLNFHPNPKYSPPSRVEQVLTGMAGYLLIDSNRNRIAKIDGTLIQDVSFGWGILGHLDRGGKFMVKQGWVGNEDWEITAMNLSMTGKILLFKSLNIQSDEVYSDFHAVAPDLSFAQGVELLRKQEATLAEKSPAQAGPRE